MSDNTAILAGFTKPVIATGGGYDLYLLVKPDEDLGQRFKAYDWGESEWVWVNGWLFDIEEVEQ